MIDSRQWAGTCVVTGVAMLSAAVWASGCGDGAVEPPPPDPPRPTSVTVTPPTVVLSALGATARLSAEVRDQNGQVMAGASVIWASSNTAVVTVDASGLVTAAANGTAIVTATAGAASATATATVAQSVSAVAVTPAADTVLVADTVRLSAGASDANGHAVAGAEFSWASSDTLTAVVDGQGLVTGVAAGEAEITATSSGVTGRATLTVAAPVPTTVAVTPDTVAFSAVGQTGLLAAEVRDQAGRPIQGVAVSWSSGDTLVASVDSTGLVTAVGGGEATVSATAEDVAGAAVVTVMQSASSVTVLPAADTIAPGDTLRLVAEAFDENGHRVQDAEFVWASMDVAVVVVDGSGLVTGIGEGRTMVSARAGDASAVSEITVENPDRAALVTLYHATGGPNWTNSENWLTDAPLDQWLGISADQQTGRVTRIELPKNNLHGPIPSELGRLGSLEHLALGENDLSGKIPPELGNLSNLRGLHLQLSRLAGPIPAEFGYLSNLQSMVLRDNRLTGPIPAELGNLDKLEWLHLGGNQLNGVIPTELANLGSLARLTLSSNQLTGAIPARLGNLSNLWALSLWDNLISGPIPPELGKLSGLRWLFLGGNDLTGPLPAELANLHSLTDLTVDGNKLAGPIPHRFLELDELERFGFDSNAGLCAPGTADFVNWLAALRSFEGHYCNQSDMLVLERLYETSGGPNWANSGGWRQSLALGEWHGVTADTLGRVVTLDLGRNGLTGGLPADLGRLAEMTALRLGGNALSGRLPLSLTRLALVDLRYADTGLCAPADATFQAWLRGIASHDGSGVVCGPLSDRETLEVLYKATRGPNWTTSDNWLSDAPLADWYGVETDESGRVTHLRLSQNGLSGSIPPEFGGLSRLELLWLSSNDLSGSIPAELGNLANLKQLTLGANNLTGPIPSELGDLARLDVLQLNGNALTGAIPPDIGNLQNLRWLALFGNNLTGPIPSELANLTLLWELRLDDNDLSGSLPPELGRLSRLIILNLNRNAFTGAVPREFGALTALEELGVVWNAGLSGVLPTSLTALRRLETFVVSGTGLCAPPESEFLQWLRGIPVSRVPVCSEQGGARAYLTQTVQSREFPVPLVAGKEALLRVFVTAPSASGADLPPVRATFYVNDTRARVVDIPGRSSPISAEVEEGDLSKSLNALVPSEIIQPGLEMVIEVDTDRTLDPRLGVSKRIPATGRQAVEVHAMPLLDLTLVPFLWTESSDSAVVDAVGRAARDPEGDDLLAQTRTLLPVSELAVTAHAPVLIDTNNSRALLSATEVIRAMEGGTGHYMGMMSGARSGPAGVAFRPGKSAYAAPSAGVVAHELGHNFSLRHAPCRATAYLDPHYPYADGRIGTWGYDFDHGKLVSPAWPDLMSYCNPEWISDYHFINAFRYRLADEGPPATAAAPPTRNSLLLWGGVDSAGTPHLNPAFVVDAPPALPDSTGPYRITGRTANSGELFALTFTMPEVADGDGSSSFAFVLPARPGWDGNLASITLSGPSGSFTLHNGSDIPMAILREPRNGQVRAILRGPPSATRAAADAEVTGARGLELLFSHGIPDVEAWRR